MKQLRQTTEQKISSVYPYFLASAVMLSLLGPPVDFWPIAWIALVPFILVCSPQAKVKGFFIASYIVGLLYWLINLYWLVPVTILGWIVFCTITAILWPITALAMRFCRAKKIPIALAASVLFVGMENFQGYGFGGFLWRLLGHSQYQNITLIQIADIFGVAGISFLIAAVNGLTAEIILAAGDNTGLRNVQTISKAILTKKTILIELGCVTVAIIGTIFYGRFRIKQSEQYISEGPIVAAVQSNIPQSVKRAFESEREILDSLLINSNQAVKAGAQFIVWPETMVQEYFDYDVWPYFREDPCQAKEFDLILKAHTRDNSINLLIGAYGSAIGFNADQPILLEYNSAFLYKSNGKKDPQRYDKIHLVLFGEYLPFKKQIPWLYNQLMKFTPYNYDYSLEAGTEYTVFEITTAGEPNENIEGADYRFGVIICYEDTVPEIARNSAVDEAGKKRIDFLVNISNDGWFVRFKDENNQVFPSAELGQHAAICSFRAIENRLAILRSVNTGISCLIDSLGRIHSGYLVSSSEFPVDPMERTGMAGWFTDKMPIDTRVTFFSKYGQWLDAISRFGLFIAFILPLIEKYKAHRYKEKKPGR